MNPAESANIAAAEENFWWYCSMRRILFGLGLLDPLARSRHIRNVLEASCGTGYNAAALRQRYRWSAYPIDLQIEGLRYAEAPGVKSLTQGDVSALPFRSGTFDTVVCLDVIVHFPRGDESPALAELARVLAPSGLPVLRVAALDVIRSRHSAFTRAQQRFTAKRLMSAVVDHRIRALHCTYAHTLLVPLALVKVPYLGAAHATGASKWRAADRRPAEPVAGRCCLLPESHWLRAGFNLPLGQSLISSGKNRREREGALSQRFVSGVQ